MGQTLRILSANLMNGGADIDYLANLVTALAVDVVALQEVSHEQAVVMAENYSGGEINPDDDYVGMGLLSRRPGRVERIPMTWGFGQTLRLEPEDWSQLHEPVEITNVHIAAPHMYDPAPGPILRWKQSREFWSYLEEADRRTHFPTAFPTASASGADHTRSTRMKSTSAANTNAGQGAPYCPGPARVLVGDFNATSYWPWYRRIARQFTDVAVAVASKRGSKLLPTWGPWLEGPKLLRIDHGFVRRLEAEEFQVFALPGTDHSAVVMDLTLPSF